jgi:hypothetical protein
MPHLATVKNMNTFRGKIAIGLPLLCRTNLSLSSGYRRNRMTRLGASQSWHRSGRGSTLCQGRISIHQSDMTAG